MSAHVLDAKGLNCPLPILHAKKRLKDVPVSEILEIQATDPGSATEHRQPQHHVCATSDTFERKTQNLHWLDSSHSD